jgi:hypothetical protein
VWYFFFFILLVFQSFDFKRTWRRLSYMTKVIVHDEGYHTWRRLSYMTKVIVHDEGYRTWRRSQKRVVRTKLDNYAFITNRMIF